MKHKIYNIALLAALCGTVFVGCKKDNPLEGTNYNTIITVKNGDAKTYYNPEDGSVLWHEDDTISVTRGSNDFSDFILSDLTDGVATFIGTIPEDITSGYYYGIYPNQDNLSVDEDHNLYCEVIRAEQTLTPGTFGKGDNTSVGCNDNTSMQFRNVGGLAKIAVKGDIAIKSITITDNDGQKLSGHGAINVFSTSNLNISWDNANSSNTVTAKTVNQTSGVDVSNGVYFYIVLPPCALSNYTVTITDVNNNTHTTHFTSSTPVVISRAKVSMLGGFSVNTLAFTVDDTGKKVTFSPGNLYWNGTYFKFENNQYDFANSWNANHVPYFHWSKDAAVACAEDYSDGVRSASDMFFTNATETTAKSNFTVNGETGVWRTLSNSEWNCLLNTRTMINGKPRYTYKTNGIEIGGTTYYGLFIYPDYYDGSEAGTDATVDSWEEINAAGIVFLPAAGASFNPTTGESRYWSSTPNNMYNAHATYFYSDGMLVVGELQSRSAGLSVRLVKDAD